MHAGADTSNSLWLNFPLAVAAVAGLYWLSLQVDIRAHANGSSTAARLRGRKWSEDGCETPHFTAPVPPAPSSKPDNRWREQVGSPVVEHAWETLCGSIIQEVTQPVHAYYLDTKKKYRAVPQQGVMAWRLSYGMATVVLVEPSVQYAESACMHASPACSREAVVMHAQHASGKEAPAKRAGRELRQGSQARPCMRSLCTTRGTRR